MPTLRLSPLRVHHRFSDSVSDGQNRSIRKLAAKQKPAQHEKNTFDPDVSILTQYSQVSHALPVDTYHSRRQLSSSDLGLSADPPDTSDENSFISDVDGNESLLTSLQDQERKTVRGNNDQLVLGVQTPKSGRKVIMKAKRPKLKFPHGENSKPVVELFDWIIKPLPDLKGVCVEGQKKGMNDFWHSSAITEVKKRKYVKTSSGTWYRLRGKINKLCTIDSGFPKSVASTFIDGFPSNWKKVLEEFYSNLEKSISVHEEYSILQDKGPKKPVGMKSQKLPAKKRQEDEKDNEVLDSILTPVGLVKRCNSANDFTVTRSGRLSLPPLARWQGQQYIFSTKTNTLQVGFHTAGAEKALLKETKDFMKVQKRYQKPMHHKSLSNSMLCSSIATETTSIEKDSQKPTDSKTPKNSKKSVLKKTKSAGRKRGNIGGIASLNEKTENKVLSLKNANKNCKLIKEGISLDLSNKKNPTVHIIDCSTTPTKFFVKNDVKTDKNLSTLTKCTNKERRNHYNHTSARKNVSDSTPKKIMNTEGKLNNTADLSSPLNTLNCSMVLRSRKKNPKDNRDDLLLNRSQKQMPEPDVQNRKEDVSFSRKNSKLEDKGTKKEEKNKKKIGSGRQNRKRKRSPSYNEDTGYCTEEQTTTAVRVPYETTPKIVRSPDRKRKRLSLQSDTEHKTTWKSKEKELFERAMRTVDAEASDFWSQVAEIVKSRTEIECRDFHTIYLEENTKKESKKKLTRKPSGRRQTGDPVQGGKGTMKRKEGMREFLQEQNENYEDNLFEGTPFVTRKLPLPMLTNIDFDKDDSEIFGANHNFFTPMTRNSNATTPGTRLRAQLASSRKTPVNQVNVCISDTPVSVTRQVADKYIHTFMQQRKRISSGSDSSSSKSKVENTSIMGCDKLPKKSLFSPSIVVYDKANDIQEEDEDGEENNPYVYYWNDDDDEEDE